MSRKHLHRYVRELAGRHNLRPLDPLGRIAAVWQQLIGKRLAWHSLVANVALPHSGMYPLLSGVDT